MGKEIDPADIGKHPVLIRRAQAEMTQSDVLVCGRCHNVFHFIELFKEHKEQSCRKDSSLGDCRETKAKVWAFLLWKASQLNSTEGAEMQGVNSWKLYQTWVKLEESVRETWIVAGRTIQSFARMGQGNLQEMPVKITKTIIEATSDSPEKKTPAPINRAMAAKRPEIRAILRNNDSDDNMDTDDRDIENDVEETKIVKKIPAPVPVRKEPVVVPRPAANKKSVAKRTSPVSSDIVEEEVEKILAKRFNPRRKEHEYLVKWSKFPHDQNTWEPLIHLQTCQSVLEYFEVQLAKQKEQRAAAAAKTLQQQQQANQAKNTPAKSAIQTGSPTSRALPARNSKAKAMDQVKQWVQDENSSQGGIKRKAEDSDYEGEDDDEPEDDEDSQSSKKFKSESSSIIQQAIYKAGQSGNVKIMPVGSKSPIKMVNGISAKPKTDDGNAAEVILTTGKDGKQSGVVKKPGVANAKSPPKNEAQVRVVNKGDSVTSGVVRILSSATSTSPATSTKTISTPVSTVGKVVAPAIRKDVAAPPTRTPAAVQRQPPQRIVSSAPQQQQQKTIQRTSLSPKVLPATSVQHGKSTISRIVKGSPTSKPATPEQKIMSLSRQGLKVVKKSGNTIISTSETHSIPSPLRDDDDDGLVDPFPKNLPPVAPPSPPRELTLCPFTGKVLGQAEGEPSPIPSPELRREAEKMRKDQEEKEQNAAKAHQQDAQTEDTQVAQFMTNEDGTPIIVAGADGTLYQVAGKNAEGQTILIAQGENGEQTLLVASQEEEEEGVLTLDAAVSEAVAQMQPQDGQETEEQTAQAQQGEGEETDPNQQLTIQTGDSDSQDGQITAEVVQADLPSPGGTRRVVLLLPDGSFMMTEVNEEQYQSLNLVN